MIRRTHLAFTLLASTIFAAPAYAQDAPFCGGISPVGEWAGGNADSSDLSTTVTPFLSTGQVPIGGHVVRLFTVSEPTSIRAEVQAIPAGDPYISLFDEAGNEIGSDDDGGGDFSSRLEMDLQPGTYCLSARSYESGVTEVAIQLGRTEHDPMTSGGDALPPAQVDMPQGPGCFEEGVPNLALGLDASNIELTVATGTVAEAPAYMLGLNEPISLSITAVSELGDPFITLIDSNGNVIAENDDFDGLNSRIDFTTPLAADLYCIEVEDLNGAVNPITVAIEGFDPVAARLGQINEAEIAPTSEDDIPIEDLGVLSNAILANVTASTAAKWFRFDVPEGGFLLAEVVGNGADPTLTLFDRVGRQIAFSDDGPSGLDSQIAVRLFPGSYLAAVKLFSEESAPVQLVLERFIPAP